MEGAGRGVQPHQSRNDLTRNANFGSGAYPTNPSSTFGQITAVGDPRTFQFGAARSILRRMPADIKRDVMRDGGGRLLAVSAVVRRQRHICGSGCRGPREHDAVNRRRRRFRGRRLGRDSPGGTTDIYAAVSRDAGRTFGA